ncbi:MAG: cation-translocating P-type ATPase [Parachlamydia sp.]|nr:cation-translocating P-type ATPase [Parachlamydia sp.]
MTMHQPIVHQPIVFEEFFEMGQQESASPFLTPQSRRWAGYLPLKAAILAAFLLVIAFILSFTSSPWLLALSSFLIIAVYFFAGIPSLIEAIQDLSSLEINIDVLMTLAAFSSVLIGSGMEGALLLVLFSLSGAMEEAVTGRAKSSIRSLHRLSPTKATVVDPDGTLVERALPDIKVGTTILVKAGQIVPLDGIVIHGTSSVNLVHLTGESLPVTKIVGNTVEAGARNLDGALTLQVTHTSSDSTLARIIQLVTQAQEARPRLQRWFDTLSRSYALTIILLSSFFALALPYILKIPFLGFEGSVYRAVAFLIAASPCALIIAIPIAYLSAISSTARRGILLKGGITLDALASCKAVAFDKTGTLTTGELSCLGLEALDPSTKQEEEYAWAIAYAMEKNAVHPIAKAILNAPQARAKTISTPTAFKSIPGYGLEAITETGPIYIGNADYILPKLTESQRQVLQQRIQEIQKAGQLMAAMLLDEKLYLFRFSDTLRPNISKSLKALRDQNLQLYMLTGDHEENAKVVAQQLGFDHYFANLKPEDKLHHVTELSRKDGLAMIGDGINDAPALARATVGICMGKVGSSAAVDASDVILLQDNIELLGWLMDKAHQTKRIVTQNLLLATSAIFIAALPALAGIVPLWLAVVMHEGGTVLVGLNALRLLRK